MSVPADDTLRGPTGPCSQQNSGVRAYWEFGWFNTQNCNTYTIKIKHRVSYPGMTWMPCATLAPGQHSYTPPVNLPQGTWASC